MANSSFDLVIHDDELSYKLPCFANVWPDFSHNKILYASFFLSSNRYVQLYGLPGPCDDFDIVSMFIARKTGFWNGISLVFLITLLVDLGNCSNILKYE